MPLLIKQKTLYKEFLLGGLFTFLLCLKLTTVYAHNNVVVIPMQGDDVPVELTPTTPIAKVNPSQTDYTIGALTVVDKITKLEWQRQDDNITRNWDDAWDYCAGLDLDGHDDWRLPTITELQSIVDYGSATVPVIDQVAFPNTNGTYWSASSLASNSVSAWSITFATGVVFSLSKTGNLYVRCVR